MPRKIIAVVDAQGGGIGKQLIAALKKKRDGIQILAVGTNSAATAAMIKAGAEKGATGENAVIYAARTADIIMGPVGIVIADSMQGEISGNMAVSIGQSMAYKVLIPFNNCNNYIVGLDEVKITALIRAAVEQVCRIIDEE